MPVTGASNRPLYSAAPPLRFAACQGALGAGGMVVSAAIRRTLPNPTSTWSVRTPGTVFFHRTGRALALSRPTGSMRFPA
jgi:hypothetical protein